jgi:hypothetical protein
MRIFTIIAFLFFPLFMLDSQAATSGLSHEVISNDKMQMYVASVTKIDMGGTNFRADVELILKNIEPKARAFNPFFAKAVDTEGNEVRLSLLLGSIQPIRIASNDILRGTLAFSLPRDAELSTLIWEEPDVAKLTVDLTKSKDPADPMPKSDWVLSSNKGKTLSDSRTQLTINDELLNRSPTYYAVDISIKNLGDAIIQYNPSFVFVKDQEGFMYPPDIKNLNLLSNPLRRGDLEKGEEVRGQVLFPIPDEVNDVMLIYDESLGTGSYFAVPEFPYHAIVLIASVGTSLLLSRISVQKR